MSNSIYQSATELAKAIRTKKISSQEVVKTHLDHIEKYNPKLNAIVILLKQSALQRAKQADQALAKGEIWGPLHGVPITIKESLNIKGQKTTINFSPLKNNTAKEDAIVVQRLKAAGAIILGKTNIPTLLSDAQTTGPIYGRTKNPYDRERSPGGSSGGEAAAVASGMSPLGIGSDIGSSIRNPAGYCGLFALKPTENTVPLKGHVPPMPESKNGIIHMANIGPLARTLQDVQLVFEIIRGPSVNDSNIAKIDWQLSKKKKLKEYKIAWSDQFDKYIADKETSNLLSQLANKLTESKTKVKKTFPKDITPEKIFDIWGHLFAYIAGPDMPFIGKLATKFQWRKVPEIGKHLAKGLKLNFKEYAKTLQKRQELISQMQHFFQEFDILLFPVTMSPTFKHCKWGEQIEIDGKKVSNILSTMVFSIPFNVTGHPSLIVPLGQSKAGLPIGMQIIGPYWSEPDLFNFAQQIHPLIQGFKKPKI